MLDMLAALAELTPNEFLLATGVSLGAGIVRGFAGFALSALIVAALAVTIPPVSLIPVCFVLEGVASVVMFRGGARAADWPVVRALVIGSVIGVPIGLAATLHASPDVSRTVALVLLLTLATLQLRRQAPAWLGTPAGRYGSGVLSGIAGGLASISGMVVALYVLASGASPERMRASLVMYLFVSMITTGIWLTVTGVLDRVALVRGGLLAPCVVIGVLIGSALFRPSLQGFYRRVCLSLLIGLAVLGLVRLAVASW